jgi:chorismate mutase
MKNYETELNNLRINIDVLDKNLITIIAFREEVIRLIADIKKEHGLPILQKDRWQKLLISRIEMAKDNNLDTKFIDGIYNLIHDESMRIQTEIIYNTKPVDK